MQILGKPFDELKILQVARAFERQEACPRLKPRLTS
jgi:Asp-tRNA(Asn)/Glu-tRNA(Gln) amidotransferase A subunit family amidase